jgi:hypothetical protein
MMKARRAVRKNISPKMLIDIVGFVGNGIAIVEFFSHRTGT